MGLREQLDAALKKWAEPGVQPHENGCIGYSEGCACCLNDYHTQYGALLDHLVKELTTGPCALCQKPGELRSDSNRILCKECYGLQWLTESHKNYPAEVPGVEPRQGGQPAFAAPFASEPSSQCPSCALWEKVVEVSGLDLADARALKEKLKEGT